MNTSQSCPSSVPKPHSTMDSGNSDGLLLWLLQVSSLELTLVKANAVATTALI